MSNRAIGLGLSLTFHAALVAGIVSWNRTDAPISQRQGGQAMKLSVSMFEPATPEESEAEVLDAQPEPQEIVALNTQRSTPAPVAMPEPKVEIAPKPKPKMTATKPTVKPSIKPDVQTQIDKASPASASNQRAGSGQASNNQEGLEDAYKKTIHQAILKQRKYPRQAKRRRAEGIVVVFFKLERDGTVSALRVLESSGIKLLDKAALDAVRKVGAFIPFPEDVDRETWQFEFPVTFSLG